MTDFKFFIVTVLTEPPIASPKPPPIRCSPVIDKPIVGPVTVTLSTVNPRYEASPRVSFNNPATFAVPKEPAIPPTKFLPVIF